MDEQQDNRRSPVKAKPLTATAIRFPPDLHASLAAAARERDLSVNYLVVAAVRDFLPRLIPIEEWRLTR